MSLLEEVVSLAGGRILCFPARQGGGESERTRERREVEKKESVGERERGVRG